MRQKGTTNDYQTALQALIDIATGTHVATAAINAAGTGYVVGDSLSVAGGTSTYTATILVTSVGGSGDITGARMENGGAYTANPTLTANAVTGGTGSGATFNLTVDGTGWTVNRRDYRAARVAVVAGGTGYSVNDRFTINGGTFTEAAEFEVKTVSGGAVTSAEPVVPGSINDSEQSGHYSVAPTGTLTTTTTNGSGSGCTVTAEFEQELIMQGEGSGSDDITVGIKTFQWEDETGFNTTYNWALFGMSNYNSGLDFWDQSNISDGFTTTPAADPDLQETRGAFVPLRDTDGSFPITFWFYITERAIKCVFKVEGSLTTAYASMYLGYLNPLGTTTELPFPMLVGGCSHRKTVWYADQTPYITSPVMADGGQNKGPCWAYESTSGDWYSICNSELTENGVSRSNAIDSWMYPGGEHSQLPDTTGADIVATGWGDWADFIPPSGVPGAAAAEMYPTEDSGGDIYWLVPVVAALTDNSPNIYLVYGEQQDVYWVGRAGALTSEDTITIGTDVYRVFQSGNRTDEFSYFAIKENF